MRARPDDLRDADVVEALGDRAYVARTGTVLDGDALDAYRLWWDLIEIATYTGLFREPHVDDEDTQIAWHSLALYLDPTRWEATR